MITLAQAATEAHTWDWNWEALVAVSTIALTLATGGLAFFTARVAAKTRDLAQEGEADRRAQWRPVLMPAGDRFVPLPEGEALGWGHTVAGLEYDSTDHVLTVRLHNWLYSRDVGSGTHSVRAVDESLLIGRLERCG